MLSGFTIYTIVSIALKVIIFLAFLWIRRRLYVLSFKLPGPLYIPLLGNLASFLFRKGSFFQRINLIILDNKEIFRFWVGSKLLLIVRNTEAVRHFSNLTIPSNDGKYAFTQGHGILMTQQIDRWRQHKKLIKSMINVKFIIDNIDVFKKHIDRCMIRMEKHTTEATFDVHVYIRNCYIDIFGEVILGIAIESQDGKNSDLTNALQTYSNFAFKRMLLTWTHVQFLLKILPTYRKKVKAENYLMSFTEEAIIKSWERRKTSLFPASNDRKNYAIVDEIGNYIETNLDTIQNEELRDYLLSLFLVSQQSLSYVTSYCCLYLGMYPEYQSRVLNEIQSISSTTLKYEYLYKLKYLDAFIQEVLSVVTIRPFIFRNFTETILFENLTIPPECTIIIPSYAMQHDVAQNSRTFNPENVSQRASHCFGQGTKECIDIFDRIMTLMNSYPHPLRFWLGPKLIVCISDAQHVEKILNSPKVIHKSYIYKFLNDFVKYGLVSHSGPTWKRDRKIIQPLINLQFIEAKFDIMQLHIDRLLTKVDDHVDGGIFNVESLLRLCNFDIMADVLLDFSVESQNEKNHNIVHAFGDVYMHVFNQMVKPWLHPNFVYNKTSQQRERQKLTDIARNFAKRAIEAACARKKQETTDHNSFSILDQILEHFMNDEENNIDVLIDHMLTLLAASEDTATIVSSAAFVVFGLYPDYQKQAFEEIRAVLGENPRHVRVDELNKLTFIDMCLRDVLRLFPIAPFIVRMCTSDLYLGDFTIPEGCEVMIPILSIHKNQKYYQYPNDFYPNHFQQGHQETRPKAAFIPFSMGFRNCIGKHLGISILKLLIIHLLWRYEFVSEGTLADIRYTTDISLRFRNGYMVYVKRRKFD